MKLIKKISLTLFFFSVLASIASAVSPEAYEVYLKGLFAARDGDYKTAIIEYTRVLELDTDALIVYKDLAVIYWQTGDHEKADEFIEKIKKLAGKDAETQLFLGSFYILSGKTDLAVKAWKTVLELDPANENAKQYISAYSDIFANENQEQLSELVKPDSDLASDYYRQGVRNFKEGDEAAAKENFLKVLELKPNSIEPYLFLGQIYENEKSTSLAVEQYLKALEIQPDNMTMLLYLGGLYFRTGDLDKADETFNKALKVNPKETSVYFWLGLIKESKKDWVAARKYFEIVEKRDASAAVLIRLSYYSTMQGRHADSIKYLKRAVKLDEKSALSHYLLGLAYMDRKKYDQAETSFTQAITLDPDFKEAYFNIAVLYDTTNRFDKAESFLLKLLEKDPKNPAVLNYLGYSYADRNINLDKALDLIKAAVEVEPKNPAFLDSLGWVYFRQKRFSEALELISESSRLLRDPEIFKHLGEIHYTQGNMNEAWNAYKQSYMLRTDDRAVKKKLEELEKNVLPGTLQRRLVKRAYANENQISSIELNFSSYIEAGDKNLPGYGRFYYMRPTSWKIEMLGNFMAPQGLIVHNSSGTFIKPEALGDNFLPFSEFAAQAMELFFTGKIVNEFSDDAVKTERKGRYYVYSFQNRKLKLDSADAGIVEYISEDIRFKITKKEIIEGLSLPKTVEIFIPAKKIKVRLKFDGVKINPNMEEIKE